MWKVKEADAVTSHYARGSLYQTDVISHFEKDSLDDFPIDSEMMNFRSQSSVGLAVDRTVIMFTSDLSSNCGSLLFDSRVSSICSLMDGNLVVCGTTNGLLNFLQSLNKDVNMIGSIRLQARDDMNCGSYAVSVKSVLSSPDQDLYDLWILMSDGGLICYRSFDGKALRDAGDISKELLFDVCQRTLRILMTPQSAGELTTDGMLLPVCINDTSYIMCLNMDDKFVLFMWMEDNPSCVDYFISETATTDSPLSKIIPLTDQQVVLAADKRGNLLLIDVIITTIIDTWCDWRVENIELLEAQYKQGTSRNDMVALLRSLDDDARVLEIRAFPELEESIFSINLQPGPVCLIPLLCDKGPLAFLDGESGIRLDLKMITEVDPNQKLVRLLAQRRFEDAEALAASFRLDSKIILVHKIGHYLDMLPDEDIMAPLFDSILNLEGLGNYLHLAEACFEAVLPSAAFQEKFLLILIEKLQDFAHDDSVKVILENGLQLLSRLKTFRALIPQPEFTPATWSRLVNAKMYVEFFKALASDNLPNSFLLWNNHKREIVADFIKFGDQAVHDMLYVIETKYRMKSSILEWFSAEFLPCAVRRLPTSCLKVITDHFYKAVEELEVSDAEHWPKNGIDILSQLLDMNRLQTQSENSPTEEALFLVRQIGCQSQESPLWSLKDLLKQLKTILSLREKYNFRVSLKELKNLNSTTIAYRMLDKELNLDILPAAMESRIHGYLKDEGLDSTAFLSGYVDDLLTRRESLDNNKNAAALETRIASVLQYLPNTSSRFRFFLRLAQAASLPWSEGIRRQVKAVLSTSSPSNAQSFPQHPLLQKLERLAKNAEVYAVLEKYEFYLTVKLSRSVTRHIIRKIAKSLLEKNKEITNEELSDLLRIGAEVKIRPLEVRNLCVEVFLACKLPLKCLAFIESQCEVSERRRLLNTAFHFAIHGDLEDSGACCIGERLRKELGRNEDCEVRSLISGIRGRRLLRRHFNITATMDEVMKAEWAFSKVNEIIREELQQRLKLIEEEPEGQAFPLTMSVVIQHDEEEDTAIGKELEEDEECVQPSPSLIRLSELLYESSHDPRLCNLTTLWCEAIMDEWRSEQSIKEELRILLNRGHGVDLNVILLPLLRELRTMNGELQRRLLADLVTVVGREIVTKGKWSTIVFLEALKIVQSLQSEVLEREQKRKALPSRLDPFSVWRFSVQYHENPSLPSFRLVNLLRLAWSHCINCLSGTSEDTRSELADSLVDANLLLLSHPLLRPLENDPAVEKVSQRQGSLIESLLSSRYLDARLVVKIVSGMQTALATRSLMSAMGRAPNSFKVVKIVSDIAFDFVVTNVNPKSQRIGERLARIARWLQRCTGLTSEWGIFLHKERYADALDLLLSDSVDSVSAATVADFCSDFQLSRESALKRFVAQKLTWRRSEGEEEEWEKKVEERLRAAQEAFDLLRGNRVENKFLESWLKRIVEEADSFEHEKIRFLLQSALQVAGSENKAELRRGLETVDFLLNWTRTNTASRAETEWLVQKTEQRERLMFSDSIILSPLARTRLPYHVMLDKPQDIIEPEINTSNVDRLVALCQLFSMTPDDLYMISVNNLIRSHVSWIRQHPDLMHSGVVWRGPSSDVDESVWAQFSKVLHRVSQPKLALQCAQAMANATPSGSEKLRALDLCIKFARQWLQSSSGSSEQEMALAKRALERFCANRKSLGLEGILHQFGLASKQQLALICQPQALLRHLLESQPTSDMLNAKESPALSAALRVAEQCELESSAEAKSLLRQWLHVCDNQLGDDLDMTFNFGDFNQPRPSSQDSDRWLSMNDDKELAKAVTLLRHPNFCPEAIDMVAQLAFGVDEWNVSRTRALYCLLHALPMVRVERLAAEQYRAQVAESGEKGRPPSLVKYTTALIYSTRVEEFSPCSVQEMLALNKADLVRRLLRDRRVFNSAKGLAVVGNLLMDFDLVDDDLWTFLLSRLHASTLGASSKPILVSALRHMLSALPYSSQFLLWSKMSPESLAGCLESATDADADSRLGLARCLGGSPLILLLIQHRRLITKITESWNATERAVLFRYVLDQHDLNEVFRLKNVKLKFDDRGFIAEELKLLADYLNFD